MAAQHCVKKRNYGCWIGLYSISCIYFWI